MQRRIIGPVKTESSNVIYPILIFFIISLIIKVVFGIVSNSKALLVASIFALFGIFICALIIFKARLSSKTGQENKPDFCHEKLEFMILAGASLIIAITTTSLLFFIAHLAIFHAISSPDSTVAWIAAILVAVNLYALSAINERLTAFKGQEGQQLIFIFKMDLIFCALTVVAVIIAQFELILADYLLAILGDVYIFVYSVYFLHTSFKGLMNASSGQMTLSDISKCIQKADPTLRVKNLKVNHVGGKLIVNAIIYLSKSAKMREAGSVMAKVKHALAMRVTEPYEVNIGFAGK